MGSDFRFLWWTDSPDLLGSDGVLLQWPDGVPSWIQMVSFSPVDWMGCPPGFKWCPHWLNDSPDLLGSDGVLMGSDFRFLWWTDSPDLLGSDGVLLQWPDGAPSWIQMVLYSPVDWMGCPPGFRWCPYW